MLKYRQRIKSDKFQFQMQSKFVLFAKNSYDLSDFEADSEWFAEWFTEWLSESASNSDSEDQYDLDYEDDYDEDDYPYTFTADDFTYTYKNMSFY